MLFRQVSENSSSVVGVLFSFFFGSKRVGTPVETNLIRNLSNRDSARNVVMNYFQKKAYGTRGKYLEYVCCFSAKSVKAFIGISYFLLFISYFKMKLIPNQGLIKHARGRGINTFYITPPSFWIWFICSNNRDVTTPSSIKCIVAPSIVSLTWRLLFLIYGSFLFLHVWGCSNRETKTK